MSIRDRYKKETGKNATWRNREGDRFCADYVEWLEFELYKINNNCVHQFETMSGKIPFVEKCIICGEIRY